MAVVEYGGWAMQVSQEVANDPVKVAEIIAVLAQIGEIDRGGNRNETDSR